jgi:hypothetical protein
MFALQLKTVFLLDARQLLMLSAGTLISLEEKMFLLNIFHYKQDTDCMLSILYVGVCFFFSFFLVPTW